MNKPVLPLSSLSLKLPLADGSLENYRLASSWIFPTKLEGTLNRVAFDDAMGAANRAIRGSDRSRAVEALHSLSKAALALADEMDLAG